MTGTVKLKKNILERSALLIMALNAVWKTTKRHFSSLLFSPPYVHLAAASCSQVQNSTSCSFQSKKVKIFTTNNFWTRLKRIVVKIESRLMNNTQIFVCHTWHTFDSNVRSITTTTSGQFFLKLNATPSKMKSENLFAPFQRLHDCSLKIGGSRVGEG